EFTKPAVIQQASYLLIAAGLFMFILSFLGYCGALRESRCLLKTYGICMVLIVVLQITAGGLAVAYKEKAEMGTKSLLKDMLTKNYESGNKTNVVTVVWNHLQAEMHCCGVDNYKDFDVTPWKKDSGKEIPESCCVLQDKATLKPLSPGCTKNPSISNSYFETGCYKAGSELVMLHIKIVIYAGIGLGIIELLCIILPFCLSKSINQYMKY
ncbi:PREDICTED: tetraspanin-18-like, partial [Nicrophorus vespilloides]|uniref:Tetraspanin n=1 Tax=Nicrophorus vespilloides TaxID=110193 RepID=A0ABM1M7I3_NICVS